MPGTAPAAGPLRVGKGGSASVPNDPPSRFRLRRWLLGLSLDDLSEQTGISVGTLSRIERGKAATVRPHQLEKLERVLESAPPDPRDPPVGVVDVTTARTKRGRENNRRNTTLVSGAEHLRLGRAHLLALSEMPARDRHRRERAQVSTLRVSRVADVTAPLTIGQRVQLSRARPRHRVPHARRQPDRHRHPAWPAHRVLSGPLRLEPARNPIPHLVARAAAATTHG